METIEQVIARSEKEWEASIQDKIDAMHEDYTRHSTSETEKLNTQWQNKYANDMDTWAAQSVEWQNERAAMGSAIDRLSLALQRAVRWSELGIGDYVPAWAKIQVCEDWQLMEDALKEAPLTWQDTPPKQDGYWWWLSDPEAIQIIVEVVRKEGVEFPLFVLPSGQHGWTYEQDASQMGGVWMPVFQPEKPVCQTCKGQGVVGGIRGQTPDNYEEVIEPCPECGSAPKGGEA